MAGRPNEKIAGRTTTFANLPSLLGGGAKASFSLRPEAIIIDPTLFRLDPSHHAACGGNALPGR